MRRSAVVWLAASFGVLYKSCGGTPVDPLMLNRQAANRMCSMVAAGVGGPGKRSRRTIVGGRGISGIGAKPGKGEPTADAGRRA